MSKTFISRTSFLLVLAIASFLFPVVASAAIARDTSAGHTSPGTSETTNTVAMTLASGDTLLLAYFGHRSGGDTLTSITWNGSNMTFVTKLKANNTNTAEIYVYCMLSPASGTHNLVANFTATTDNTNINGVAYSGTNSTACPTQTTTSGPTTTSPLSASLTPSLSGSWTNFYSYNNSGFSSISDTEIAIAAGSAFTRLADSNGTVTGSKTMTATFASDTAGGIMVVVAPPAATFQLWPLWYF